MMLKISIVYDNTTIRKDLEADWGFAAYIETEDMNILFDMGSDGHILLENMKKMHLDPLKIDKVFISHHHFDHTGGLASFLHINPDVDVYVPISLRGVRRAKSITHVEDAITLTDGIYSTGELENIEQSLVIDTPAGAVVIAGCSHPGLGIILEAAKVHGKIHMILGGFHGFREFDILNDIDFVCPTHCTRHIEEIKKRYSQKYIPGGAGKIIEIPITNNQGKETVNKSQYPNSKS